MTKKTSNDVKSSVISAEKSPRPLKMNETIPGYELANNLRYDANNSLGVLLTTVEAVLPPGPQLDALKELIKQEMWQMMDKNQAIVYKYVEKIAYFRHRLPANIL